MTDYIYSIEAKNVNKTFNGKRGKVHALQNFNIKIKKGSIHGLLGPNGAGKSTFINILGGLAKKNTGFIFSISGIQGFMTGDSSVEDKGLQTIEAETQSLQQAVDQTVSGLSSLNKNLSAATAATESFNVPKDINENLNSYNDNLSSAAAKLTNINELYDSLNKSLSEVNSSTSSMNIPEGLGEELNKMKSTINELNAKYSSMLEGMNK